MCSAAVNTRGLNRLKLSLWGPYVACCAMLYLGLRMFFKTECPVKMLLSWCGPITLGECGCLKCHENVLFFFFFFYLDHSCVFSVIVLLHFYFYTPHSSSRHVFSMQSLLQVRGGSPRCKSGFVFMSLVNLDTQRNNQRSSVNSLHFLFLSFHFLNAI